MPDLPPPPARPEWTARVLPVLQVLPWRGVAAGVTALLAAAALLLFSGAASRASSRPEVSIPRADAGLTAPASEEPAEMVVHVAGAVTAPGIYRLPPGSRVADAVAAAGGPVQDADVHRLNLAAPVRDGDRVYVPAAGEPVETASAGAVADGIVDLNVATADDLDELPGIGPAIAQAIIRWRAEHGPFRSVEQLLDVPGIGDAKLAELRPLVRV